MKAIFLLTLLKYDTALLAGHWANWLDSNNELAFGTKIRVSVDLQLSQLNPIKIFSPK